MQSGTSKSREWAGRVGTYTITAQRSIKPPVQPGKRKRYGPPGGNVRADVSGEALSVGNLTFTIDEAADVVRIVDVTIRKAHRAQGLGLEMIRLLFEAMADYDISKEPTHQLDTDDGRKLIARARANGLHIHDAECVKVGIKGPWDCTEECRTSRVPA